MGGGGGKVFRFGRVPECDLNVTSVARKSKLITSWETTMGMPTVVLVMIANTHWSFVNLHLLRIQAAPICKDEEGSSGDPSENPLKWSLCQYYQVMGVTHKGLHKTAKSVAGSLQLNRSWTSTIVKQGVNYSHPSYFFPVFPFGTEMLKCLVSYI